MGDNNLDGLSSIADIFMGCLAHPFIITQRHESYETIKIDDNLRPVDHYSLSRCQQSLCNLAWSPLYPMDAHCIWPPHSGVLMYISSTS